MSQQFDAIYDHGVLKPLLPLNLPDQARVKVTFDVPRTTSPDNGVNVSKAERERGAADGIDTASDFDAELEALLFDGPSLPPDFSRADIYA